MSKSKIGPSGKLNPVKFRQARLYLVASLFLIAVGLTRQSLAEYSYFYTSTGGSVSGSDIIMKEMRWPYWNSYYYNTWVNDNWTSSDGVSGYFYNGLALPAAGSPNPVGTQQTFNFSFWPLSNPIHINDTIGSVYTSPTTFSMQTIGEGTLFRSPGLWSLWQTNAWYRIAIRTWRPVSGVAHQGYAGTWLRDPVAKVWYHMATVQLPFNVTGISGADGFQENASGSDLPERTDYRNCYYHLNGAWKPANHFQIYDHAGATENAGLIETNTAVYYETCENDPAYTGTVTNAGQSSPVFVISNQPANPTFDPIIVTNYGATVTSTQLLVQWQIPATSSPQFAYQINVYTNASDTGTVVASFYDIAPDTRQQLLAIPGGVTPYPQLTIIDVFNQTNAPVSVGVTNASLLAAASAPGLVNGLNFSYYESAANIYSSGSGTNWPVMPDFTSLTPVYNGAANNLDLTSRRRRDGYAFNYTGYINVPADGLYTFTLNSDAGSKLFVDGQLVINWDGEHSPSDVSGWAGLQSGYHTINVQYFCDTQPTALFDEYFDKLSLAYAGPGIALTPVPDSVFFRPAASAPTVSLSSPPSGATVSGANVPLAATVVPNGFTINNVQFYVGNNYWAQDLNAPFSVNSFLWSSNNNPIRARILYNTTNILDSTAHLVTTTNMGIAPWQFGQIFYHNLPDGASIAGGTYSVIGDGMNLLTREVSSNCTLIAHLSGLPGTATAPDGSTPNSSWEAGIILRGNTNMTPGYPWGQTGTAPFTAVFGEVGGGAYYQDETMVNGGGGYASGSLGSQTWFEIQRTNNIFISSVSADGAHWNAVFTNMLSDFGSTVYAGFFTYAGPSSNPNVPWASFDSVSLTGNISGPPGVTIIPASDTLYTGQNATLTASPSGNAPFTYQWQLNGTNISDATNTTLNLTNLQPAATGLYAVVLNSSSGTATASAPVIVLTPPAPVATVLSNNPIGYWRLNETTGPTAYDVLGNFNGTGQGGVAFGVPGVTNSPFTGFGSDNLAAQFGGAGSPSDIAIPPINVTTTNFTIAGWVKCNGVQDSYSGLVFSRGSGHGVGLMVVNNRGNELRYGWNDNGNDYNASTGLILPQGQWAFVGLTISPSQAIVYFATNATLQSWTNKTTNIGQTFSGNFFFGCDPSDLLSSSRQFNGALDEISIYDQTLSAVQIGGILTASEQAAVNDTTYVLAYAAGANGTVNGASLQTVNDGGNGAVVTAVANSGYIFSNWSDGSTANPRTDIDVTNDISVTASFVINTNGTGYVDQVLALGPNSYWRLDEANGSTTLVDASGNGHDATPQGTGLVLGVSGPQSPAYPQFETNNTAAQFDGASNWISGGTAASLSGTNDFTLSAWIRTSATTNGVILQQRDVANFNGEYQLGVNPNGTVNFFLYGSGGYQFNLTTTQAVNDGQWHMVIAERSAGTNGYIYIDDVLAASANGAAEPLLPTINTYIGRDVRNADNTFVGQIDEVAIFNQALSSNQVTRLANTNHYNLPLSWSSNPVGAVATPTTATYFNQAFSVSGSGAGLASSSDNFWFVNLPLTNDLTITAEIGSFQTNGPAPLAGVMVRESTNAGAMFVFMGLTPTNSAKWIYRSGADHVSSSTTFKNLTWPYWVRLVRSTNTFTGYVSSNGVAWEQSASLNIPGMSTNAVAGLVVSTGTSNIFDTAEFNNVSVTNDGVLINPPEPPADSPVAGMGSFTVESGSADFIISGGDDSLWQIEESDDLVHWTAVETVTLIGGSVIQSQADATGAAEFYRLVQVD